MGKPSTAHRPSAPVLQADVRARLASLVAEVQVLVDIVQVGLDERPELAALVADALDGADLAALAPTLATPQLRAMD